MSKIGQAVEYASVRNQMKGVNISTNSQGGARDSSLNSSSVTTPLNNTLPNSALGQYSARTNNGSLLVAPKKGNAHLKPVVKTA